MAIRSSERRRASPNNSRDSWRLCLKLALNQDACKIKGSGKRRIRRDGKVKNRNIYPLRQSGDWRSRAAARLRAVEEEVALAGVAGEGGGAGELLLGLGKAAELEEEVAADAG